MHEELVAIIELWDNVHRGDTLQQERADCVDARRSTKVDKAAKAEALEAAREALEAVRSEERRVMRRLDSYRKRVREARHMLDTGTAPDYRLIEQQFRACTEIVDDLETEALELMEQRDDAEQAAEQATKAFEAAQQAATDAVAHERERVPAIDRELEDLDLARPALKKALAPAHRSAFQTLRARRRSAVAQMRNGACRVCNFAAPPQVYNEIQGQIRVHACRNCGRFLLPEPTKDA